MSSAAPVSSRPRLSGVEALAVAATGWQIVSLVYNNIFVVPEFYATLADWHQTAPRFNAVVNAELPSPEGHKK